MLLKPKPALLVLSLLGFPMWTAVIPMKTYQMDGSVIAQPSIWAGRHTPDLNGKRKFLRGGQDATALDMEDDMIQGNSW